MPEVYALRLTGPYMYVESNVPLSCLDTRGWR
jgi:hypothetical protein